MGDAMWEKSHPNQRGAGERRTLPQIGTSELVAARACVEQGVRVPGGGSLTVRKVRENAAVTLGRMVKFAGVGRDPFSPRAVGCAKHNAPYTDDCPDPVIGPHGALA